MRIPHPVILPPGAGCHLFLGECCDLLPALLSPAAEGEGTVGALLGVLGLREGLVGVVEFG